MSEDDDLFSLAAAKAARDKAVETVSGNADEAWKEAAMRNVEAVAIRHDTFTVDDVQKLMKDELVATHEGRAMGAILLQACKRGWIESTGTTVRSKQRHCHANPRTLWRSKLVGRVAA